MIAASCDAGERGRQDSLDDIVTTTSLTLNGLTVGCARCHDHKFDPIPQEDYYRLQAVFAGVDRADRPYDTDPKIYAARRVLIVPLGSLEQHGPHLPLDTDTRIAVAVARGAAASRDGVAVTPPVAFGASLGIGVFSQAVFWNYPRATTVDLALFVGGHVHGPRRAGRVRDLRVLRGARQVGVRARERPPGRADVCEQRFEAIDQKLTAVDTRFDKVDGRLDRLDGSLRKLREDMPGIVGDAVRTVMRPRNGKPRKP